MTRFPVITDAFKRTLQHVNADVAKKFSLNSNHKPGLTKALHQQYMLRHALNRAKPQ